MCFLQTSSLVKRIISVQCLTNYFWPFIYFVQHVGVEIQFSSVTPISRGEAYFTP